MNIRLCAAEAQNIFALFICQKHQPSKQYINPHKKPNLSYPGRVTVCTQLYGLGTQYSYWSAPLNRRTIKNQSCTLWCWKIKKIKLNWKRPWNFENCLLGLNSLIDSGNPDEVIGVPLLGCWFRIQINYKFIINYEVLPLALLSCGLRKRQILKSSEPISILFLASQSHKRSYLRLGDLLLYIPFMYRLISWCSDLWHLNRKDAYKKQRQSRRDPNTLPGPWQGQSKTGVPTQHSAAPLSLMPMGGGGCGRSLWGGKPQIARVSCRDGCSWPCFSQQHPPPAGKWSTLAPWCKSDALRGRSSEDAHRMVLGWKGP